MASSTGPVRAGAAAMATTAAAASTAAAARGRSASPGQYTAHGIRTARAESHGQSGGPPGSALAAWPETSGATGSMASPRTPRTGAVPNNEYRLNMAVSELQRQADSERRIVHRQLQQLERRFQDHIATPAVARERWADLQGKVDGMLEEMSAHARRLEGLDEKLRLRINSCEETVRQRTQKLEQQLHEQEHKALLAASTNEEIQKRQAAKLRKVSQALEDSIRRLDTVEELARRPDIGASGNADRHARLESRLSEHEQRLLHFEDEVRSHPILSGAAQSSDSDSGKMNRRGLVYDANMGDEEDPALRSIERDLAALAERHDKMLDEHGAELAKLRVRTDGQENRINSAADRIETAIAPLRKGILAEVAQLREHDKQEFDGKVEQLNRRVQGNIDSSEEVATEVRDRLREFGAEIAATGLAGRGAQPEHLPALQKLADAHIIHEQAIRRLEACMGEPQQSGVMSAEDLCSMLLRVESVEQRVDCLEQNGGEQELSEKADRTELRRVQVAMEELSEPLRRLSQRTASNEARNAALERRVEQLQQLHTNETVGSSGGSEGLASSSPQPPQSTEEVSAAKLRVDVVENQVKDLKARLLDMESVIESGSPITAGGGASTGSAAVEGNVSELTLRVAQTEEAVLASQQRFGQLERNHKELQSGAQSLKENHSEHAASMKRLDNKFEDLVSRISDTLKRVVQNEERAEGAAGAMQIQLEETISSLNERLESLSSESGRAPSIPSGGDFSEELATMRNEFSKRLDKVAAQTNQALQDSAGVKQSSSSIEKELNSLRGSIGANLEARVAEALARVESSDKVVAGLRLELQDEQAARKAGHLQIQEISKRVQDAEACVEASEAATRAVREELMGAGSEDTSKECMARLDMVEQRIASIDSKELEKGHVILQQQLEAIGGENTAHRQRIESLTSQLQQASEHEKSFSELEAMRQEQKKSFSELDAMRQEHRNKFGELDAMRQEHKKSFSELDAMKQEHKKSFGVLNVMKQEHKNSSSELDALRKMIEQLKEELKDSISKDVKGPLAATKRKEDTEDAAIGGAVNAALLEEPPRPILGELSVRVISGYNLSNVESGNFGNVSDPFVVVSVGEEEQETKVVSNCLNPVWDAEPFSFAINGSSEEGRVVTFSVFDHNSSGMRRSLGWVQVDVIQSALVSGDRIRAIIPLQKVLSGEIDVELQFTLDASEVIPCNVVMFSGCKDSQTSADVSDTSSFGLADSPAGAGGACTCSMIKALENNPVPSWEELLSDMREILKAKRYTQIPQLSTSRQLDLSSQFSVLGFQPSGNGRCRSVLVGINYVGTRSQLSGCHNDVKTMQRFLAGHGFSVYNQRVLMDDNTNEQPTKENIMAAMAWLVDGAAPGDSLFFHYSGHGTLMDDTSGDETDGKDEALVPVDYQSMGMFSDDQVSQCLVAPLPAGVQLTCVMDCCHSGTIMDLPFTFKADKAERGVKRRGLGEAPKELMLKNNDFVASKFRPTRKAAAISSVVSRELPAVVKGSSPKVEQVEKLAAELSDKVAAELRDLAKHQEQLELVKANAGSARPQAGVERLPEVEAGIAKLKDQVASELSDLQSHHLELTQVKMSMKGLSEVEEEVRDLGRQVAEELRGLRTHQEDLVKAKVELVANDTTNGRRELNQAVGPAWTRGEIEKPAGTRDMGSWTASVYTQEQQNRLNVDEHGKPRQAASGTEAAGRQQSASALESQVQNFSRQVAAELEALAHHQKELQGVKATVSDLTEQVYETKKATADLQKHLKHGHSTKKANEGDESVSAEDMKRSVLREWLRVARGMASRGHKLGIGSRDGMNTGEESDSSYLEEDFEEDSMSHSSLR